MLLIEKTGRLGGSAFRSTGNLPELSGPSAVAGATIRTATGDEVVVARAGVVLATGGLEASEALKEASLPVPHMIAVGSPGHTGDGLLAPQQAVAALWDMGAPFGLWAFQPPTGGGAHRAGRRGRRRPRRLTRTVAEVDRAAQHGADEIEHPAGTHHGGGLTDRPVFGALAAETAVPAGRWAPSPAS